MVSSHGPLTCRLDIKPEMQLSVYPNLILSCNHLVLYRALATSLEGPTSVTVRTTYTLTCTAEIPQQTCPPMLSTQFSSAPWSKQWNLAWRPTG